MSFKETKRPLRMPEKDGKRLKIGCSWLLFAQDAVPTGSGAPSHEMSKRQQKKQVLREARQERKGVKKAEKQAL